MYFQRSVHILLPLVPQNIFYKLSILSHYDYTFYFVMAMLEGEIITILLHFRFSLFF